MTGTYRSRKHTILWCTVLALCLLLAGCAHDSAVISDEESAAAGIYRIYYLNPEGTALVRNDLKTVSEDFDGILAEIMEAFQHTDSTQYRTALPDSVKINSTTTGIAEIDVDFSAEYLSLDRISELMLRAALVSTLLQLQGVDTVRFTVDSQSLVIDNQEIGAMTDETFIVPTGDAINSYRNQTLTLYFPNADGSKLIQEIQTIYYSTNVNTERLAVEQLIKGPNNPNLIMLTTQSVLINNIATERGICTVDFSAEINSSPFADNPTNPETTLYAFVNSIIDSYQDGEIEGVRFLIDGASETRFRGEVNLEQTFYRNAELIDTSGASVQKEGTIVDEQQPVMMEQEVTEAAD